MASDDTTPLVRIPVTPPTFNNADSANADGSRKERGIAFLRTQVARGDDRTQRVRQIVPTRDTKRR